MRKNDKLYLLCLVGSSLVYILTQKMVLSLLIFAVYAVITLHDLFQSFQSHTKPPNNNDTR